MNAFAQLERLSQHVSRGVVLTILPQRRAVVAHQERQTLIIGGERRSGRFENGVRRVERARLVVCFERLDVGKPGSIESRFGRVLLRGGALRQNDR